MSRQRNTFGVKFESDFVIELLKGEKNLNTLATENNIQPNLSYRWKKESFLLRNVVIDKLNQEWSIDITYNSNQARISASDCRN